MSETVDSKSEADIRDLIAARAYELWENQGRPHGSDLLHWRQAEAEMRECMQPASANGNAAQTQQAAAAE
ncbi:MAG: DUF2934 domain-containing protein [Acetobacteraceae bacterium]|nr:DUF2934 domain-containing protein [Acetobacteraceae bacterium]